MIVTERVGRTFVVRIDRAHKRNAIDVPTAEGIEAALDEYEDDPSLWVAIIVGDGGVFSAGSDLKDGHGGPLARGGEYGIVRRRATKPLIAAVEGLAFGGGFEIALSCDLVVAATTARFALPEARRGVIASSGALFMAARKLPYNVAVDLLLTGAELDAQRAHAFGLVNRIAPEGKALEAALELAETICVASPNSVSRTLQALRTLAADGDVAGWAENDAARADVLHSADRAEGVAAFFEKRQPVWSEPPSRDSR